MKKISLKDANSEAKLFSIRMEDVNSGDYWMLVTEDMIFLKEQPKGERQPISNFAIEKKHFNKLVSEYLKERTIILKEKDNG